MKHKKIWRWLLSTLAFSVLLTSCVRPDDSTQGDSDTSDPNNVRHLTLLRSGVAHFDVVTKRLTPSDSIRAQGLTALYDSLYNSTKNGKDTPEDAPQLLVDTEYTPRDGRFVILVGETSFAESAQAISEAAADEYGYRVINDKIVVYGHTLEELRSAGGKLLLALNNLAADENGQKRIDIPENLAQAFHSEVAMASLPKPTVGEDSVIVDAGDDARLFVASGCKVDDFEQYISVLKENGFAVYAENTIEDNRFATLTKEDIIADVWYTDDGYLRVTAESGFDLLPRSSETPAYTKVCQSGMTLVGDTGGGGMCLFFLLEDGRFVIVDGGLGTSMGPQLYQQLRKQAPDPDHITIACWIFTHSHQDHIGAFQYIARSYKTEFASKLTLESVLFNFPGNEQGLVSTQQLAGTDDELRGYLKTVFPDAKRYKAHPGNETTFANMRVEVLASHESYIFREYPEYYNACCLFLKITIGDQVICLEGDADATNNRTLAKLYGGYLKCDILQADHHGSFGGVAVTNRLFSPEVVLYFNYEKAFRDQLISTDYNQQLIDRTRNPNFKEYLIVYPHVTYLPLPYTAGSAQIIG